MDEKLIALGVRDILREKFGVTLASESEVEKLPLASKSFGFSAVQMYQLLMCIEEKFNIYFTSEEIVKYGFHNLSEIYKAIQIKLN